MSITEFDLDNPGLCRHDWRNIWESEKYPARQCLFCGETVRLSKIGHDAKIRELLQKQLEKLKFSQGLSEKSNTKSMQDSLNRTLKLIQKKIEGLSELLAEKDPIQDDELTTDLWTNQPYPLGTEQLKLSKPETSSYPLGKEETSPYPLGKEETSPYPLGKEELSSYPLGKEDTSSYPLGKENTSPYPLGKEDTSSYPLGKEDTSSYPLGKDKPKQRRAKGEGTGTLRLDYVTKRGKRYKQWSYHVEIWSNGVRIQKNCYYINKALLPYVTEMNEASRPVEDILDFIKENRKKR